jgi:hypothetical protein
LVGFCYTLGKIAENCLQDFAGFPTAPTKAARKARNRNVGERSEHAFVIYNNHDGQPVK